MTQSLRITSVPPGEAQGAGHCPVAEDEVHMLLIEPTGTPNSGDPKTAAPRRVI